MDSNSVSNPNEFTVYEYIGTKLKTLSYTNFDFNFYSFCFTIVNEYLGDKLNKETKIGKDEGGNVDPKQFINTYHYNNNGDLDTNFLYTSYNGLLDLYSKIVYTNYTNGRPGN